MGQCMLAYISRVDRKSVKLEKTFLAIACLKRKPVGYYWR